VKKSSRRNPDAGFDELRRRLRESNHRLRYVSSSARATAVPRKLANIASSTNLPPTLYERDCMRPTTAEDAAAVSTVLCVACDQRKLSCPCQFLARFTGAFSQGRINFSGVSSEQQRIMHHQSLRSARLEEMETQRLRAYAAAAQQKQRQRTAAERATVEHLALRAADNMTQSVNEALSTYCAFEEMPMYTPPVSTLDGWRTLGFTVPGMSEHKQPSLGHNTEGIIATRSLWQQPRPYRNAAGEGKAWRHPFLTADSDSRGNKNTHTNTDGFGSHEGASVGRLASMRRQRSARSAGGDRRGGSGFTAAPPPTGSSTGPSVRPQSSSSRRGRRGANGKGTQSYGGVLSSTYESEVKGASHHFKHSSLALHAPAAIDLPPSCTPSLYLQLC